MGHFKIIAALLTAIVWLGSGPSAEATLASGALAQNFNFNGTLTDANGPIITATVLKLQIYDPAATPGCLLYEETQTVTPDSEGKFSVRVGAGTRANSSVDGGLTWTMVFQNTTTLRNEFTPNCTPGYTPAAGDSRKLRVTVASTVLTPDYVLGAVPTATVAETLQGKSWSDIQTATQTYSNTKIAGKNVTAPNGTVDGKMLTWDNTNDAWAYTTVPAGGSSDASTLTSGTILAARMPALSGDVTMTSGTTVTTVEKIRGKNIPLPSGADDGKAIRYNNTSGAFEYFTPSASDATKLPLAGGNMAGIINMTNDGGTTKYKITNLADPSVPNDAANKTYVDSAVSAGGASFILKAGDTMTGGLGVPSGSPTAAGLFVGASANTGLFSPAANNIGFTAGGSEKMRLDASGKLAIGTTAPVAGLDVRHANGFSVGNMSNGSGVTNIYELKGCSGGVGSAADSMAPSTTVVLTLTCPGLPSGGFAFCSPTAAPNYPDMAWSAMADPAGGNVKIHVRNLYSSTNGFPASMPWKCLVGN